MGGIAGIPGSPAIPGLSFRRPQGEIDFKILAEVMQRSRDADLFELVKTPEDVADALRELVGSMRGWDSDRSNNTPATESL